MNSYLKKVYSMSILVFVVCASTINLSSCQATISDSTTTATTPESTSEESSTALANLPSEVQESILYSPSEGFKHVGTRSKKDTFCFAGDLILAEKPRLAYDKGGIDAIVDQGIRLLFENSDLNVANLECCITDEAVDKADKEWTFALPTKYVKAIKESGIKLLTLANNHILDFGTDALINTIKVLDENNIFHIGAGENIREASKIYIEEIEGKRYAFIGVSAVIPHETWKANETRAGVANGYDTMTICNRILNLKSKLQIDKVIVYIHWGRELELYSGEMQQMIGRRLVDAGADLVVGTHAHVVQEIEYYKNVPIVYSLGNFVYGGTMRDMIILQAIFDYSENEKGDLKIKVYPGIANYQKAIRYYDEETLKEKIDEINRKSRNCIIDYSGNVNIMDKIDENSIEFKVLPGIFPTTTESSSAEIDNSEKNNDSIETVFNEGQVTLSDLESKKLDDYMSTLSDQDINDVSKYLDEVLAETRIVEAEK